MTADNAIHEPETAAPETVVVDAAALVDLLAGTEYAAAVATRLRHTTMHAPAVVDAEVLSALGRLHRAGEVAAEHVDVGLTRLGTAPVTRHLLPGLLAGAWARRGGLRLTDALYVELADQLNATLVTTDHRLARGSPLAEAITV